MAHDTQNYLEMIDRPAFLVRDGIIQYCNEAAKHRQVLPETAIGTLLPDGCKAYEDFEGGILYLTLTVGSVECGATVVEQGQDHIFLMDRDTDKLQLQLLSLAGQQLRLPLSNLMVLSDTLFPQLQEKGQAEKAEQMTKSLFQLMRIIGNMADADRCLSLGKESFVRTELCRLFRELVENANSVLDTTGIRLHFETAEKHIFTLADKELLERAVYNLLSNAVKFSEPGTCVKVKLVRLGELAYLTVEDQGDGIADHVRSSLFHRYLREPAIEDSRFGLGLGMTIVRTAAAKHGGTVLIDQPGGTRVTMTMAIRKFIPDGFHDQTTRIGAYTGGYEQELWEFAEFLPTEKYRKE